MRRYLWQLALVLGIGLAPLALACGPDSDCMVGERSYRITMPEGQAGPVGALVFSHGYRGTSAGVMRNRGLRRLANELGVALIAAHGVDGNWDLPGTPQNISSTGEEELRYFDALLADAKRRFALDPDRIVATGFSSGGMMTWNLACHRSAQFAGFIPMSGTFWVPEPAACTGPAASIVHVHGDADRVVPLGGRPIELAHQGDVRKTLAMYAGFGGFVAATGPQPEGMRCAHSVNEAGNVLNFCLFSGGHSFRLAHLRAGWEMLVAAGRL